MEHGKNDAASNEKLVKFYHDYQSISSFFDRYNNISCLQFDHSLMDELALFISDPGIDFKMIEEQINKINLAMPHIKNIFKRPLLHLKEDSMVMPAEVANRVDNDTIIHISTHSELWDKLEKDTLKPSKLLTRIYKDDYTIYENRVFCNTIDYILHFSRKYLRMLKDLAFTNQLIQLNLLERVNHINYFLALGKLHTGYFRQFDSDTTDVQKYILELQDIYDEISKRLKSPVYKNNKRHREKVKLHRTNILAMHKDYRKIYSLAKFLRKKDSSVKSLTRNEMNQLKLNYFNYVQALTIFSTTHFNFESCKNQKIDFNSLTIKSKFKDWKLIIKSSMIEDINVIKLSIEKDSIYEIVLIPSLINSKENEDEIDKVLNKIKKLERANEYLICTPFENHLQNSRESFISISDINSFRRIQQVLLRGMILSDLKRTDCPFCKGHLEHCDEHSNKLQVAHHCKTCRTLILDAKCPTNNSQYVYSEIMHFQQHYLWEEDDLLNEEWITERKIENQMFFRNISKINQERETVCPHCNKVHIY